MISKEWIDEVAAALECEADEEMANCPLLDGYSLELFAGDKAKVERQLREAPRFKLRELQESGFAITHLEYRETRHSDAEGRALLVFDRREGLGEEGANFRTRDLVLLFDHKKRLLSRGSVWRLDEAEVALLADDLAGEPGQGPFLLTRGTSDATLRYNRQTLRALGAGRCAGALGGHFVRLFFGGAAPGGAPDLSGGSAAARAALGEGLSPAQAAAVGAVAALGPGQHLVVHGPPGTGKTTALARAVRAFLAAGRGRRVLVAGPSNTAVDNLLLRLADLDCVRLGALGRLTQARLRPLLLDARVQAELRYGLEDQSAAARELERQRRRMGRTGARGDFLAARRALRQEGADVARRRRELAAAALAGTPAVFATLSGCCGQAALEAAAASGGFDLVVVDEAGQALDVQLIAAMMLCKGALVLCGDPMQLPPTICSARAAASQAFAGRLLERLAREGLAAVAAGANNISSAPEAVEAPETPQN